MTTKKEIIGANEVFKTKEDNWEHRSENMACKTCMWFVLKEDILGRCRKHAPTMNGWPVMFKSDWCGDHKVDENKCQT